MTDLKWMLSSDQQFPYQDDRVIKIWFDVMRWFKPDVVDYLGDTSDQYCYSRFQEGTTKEFLQAIPDVPLDSGANPDDFDYAQHLMRNVVAEEKDTREFYAKTREMNPDAEIFSALGNHDIRVFNYADKHMQEIADQITPEKLWDLDKLGIDYIYYSDLPRLRYGGIYAHHGISAPSGSGDAVKTDITNLGVSLIRGHSHRLGTYFRTYELKDETLRGWEIGHMCDPKSFGMRYTQVHNWQKGFAVGFVSGGQAHIQLIEILPDYTCWVAGKKFSA